MPFGEQLANRAILGNRVRGRLVSSECVAPVFVRFNNAAKVCLRLIIVLYGVQRVRRDLPHIQRRAANALPTLINNLPPDNAKLSAFHGLHDQRRTGRQQRRCLGVERAKNRLVGNIRRRLMINAIHAGRQCEHVVQQLVLITPIVAELTRPFEKLERRQPLTLSQLHLPGKLVQMGQQ